MSEETKFYELRLPKCDIDRLFACQQIAQAQLVRNEKKIEAYFEKRGVCLTLNLCTHLTTSILKQLKTQGWST